MSYTNPIINTNNTTPIGLDAAIASIRTDMASLSFISKSFGRAWTFREVDIADNNRVRRVPKVYEDSGEYINVLPNDSILDTTTGAFSFMYCNDPQQYTNFSKYTGSNLRTILNLIVWGDLKKIDSSKDFIFIETLKAQVADKLSPNPYVSEIISWVDNDVRQVFNDFDLIEGDRDSNLLAYPFAGFRVEFAVEYPEPCL